MRARLYNALLLAALMLLFLLPALVFARDIGDTPLAVAVSGDTLLMQCAKQTRFFPAQATTPRTVS